VAAQLTEGSHLSEGPATSDIGTASTSREGTSPFRGGIDQALNRKVHQATAGIAADIEALSFNKAVAKIYDLANAIEKAAPSASRDNAIRTITLLASPMVPHLAEEAWILLGGQGLIADAAWPVIDPALLVENEVTIAVQVRGKLRDTLTVEKGLSQEALQTLALASEKVQHSIDGADIRKVIVVPDRLVNIVL
jgi:leucyl-tRNA synthetase